MRAANMRTTILTLGLFACANMARDVDAGFDAYRAAQVMVQKSGQSWEWGTAAEALLELYDPDLSVYSSNAFPGGKIPQASPDTFALQYARQFINTESQVFVGNSAVGDPASLGVSAILLGQSDSKYIDASKREADYILNDAPRYSNGAISHRPDVAELWADNVAMSFPFLAYLAVQNNDIDLMATTVTQIGLYRDILKGGNLNWMHIIGPQSQDTGLWSTGNGWAALGMVRVLHTLQKWPGSSSMSSQAGQLKSWIKEILDGAMQSDTDNGLLRNYLNDGSWFGETSGSALLSAMAYRMAVNDPGMFGKSYITWADNNRKSLASKEGDNGIFLPAVNPYDWKDRAQYTAGSPEGQAFAVMLYTAYRDCANAGICQAPAPTTISHPGIGPIDILTVLNAPITFSEMPAPTGTICGGVGSCDADGCNGKFLGDVKYPTCTAGDKNGCKCSITDNTCGPHASCDEHGCAGSFNNLGNVPYPVCTGNFEGCKCLPSDDTCGPRQSCDKNDCQGSFDGLGNVPYPECTKNFIGCKCNPEADTCGPRQSCDKNECNGSFNGLGNVKYGKCTKNFVGCDCDNTDTTCGPRVSCDANGCAGSFNGLGNVQYPVCTGNFVNCKCIAQADTCGSHASCDANGCSGSFNGLGNVAYGKCTGNFEGCDCDNTATTCGAHLSCDLNGCQGSFNGLGNVPLAKCTHNFKNCDCLPQPDTCGPPQDCGKNGCNGRFNLDDGKAYCTGNFQGCECQSNPGTCGEAQSCDQDHCNGQFQGLSVSPVCTNFFKGCVCQRTDNTCGPQKSCDDNGCNGGYDSNSVARCQGNFKGCKCNATKNTCGQAQDCDKGGCNGGFLPNSNTAVCQAKFKGCVCNPVAATCGETDSCSANGCNGNFNGGNPICTNNKYGCPCRPDPIWIPPPPRPPPQQTYTSIVLLAHEIDTPQPHEVTPNVWHFFNLNGVFTGDEICTFHDLCSSGGTPSYPTSMPTFNVEHFTNCNYSGSSDSVGSMSCNGATSVNCVDTKGGSDCNNIGGSLYPDSAIVWVVQCTITGPGSV